MIPKKKKEELKTLASTFKPQITEVQCETACITNTLNDLFRRKFHYQNKKYKFKDINKLCGWREGLLCSDKFVIPALSKELKKYMYHWKDKSINKRRLDELIEIINDPHTSIPIVSVSPEFMEIYEIPVMGQHQRDHAILVLYADEDEVLFHDPYEIFIRKKHGEIKLTIPTAKFLRYWGNADSPGKTSWAEPILGDSQKSLIEFPPMREGQE